LASDDDHRNKQAAKHAAEPARLLRKALVNVLSLGSWEAIESDHRRVGLAWRSELKPGWGKPKYVGEVIAGLAHDEVVALGRRCLELLSDRELGALQDAIWWLESGGVASLSVLTRRAIARGLEGRVICRDEGIVHFMSRCAGVTHGWDQPSIEYGADGKLYKTESNVFAIIISNRPPEVRAVPYSHSQLLEAHGFFTWPDQRALAFLEQLVHPTVRQGSEQLEWVSWLNALIATDGFRLAETGRLSQHPVFSAGRWLEGVHGRPKNLIFASPTKPDLRFRDAINNDIEIVTNSDKVLVYDRPIGSEGLSWRELQAWWAEEQGIADPRVAKESLYRRLRESLPVDSPPQQLLFKAFFKIHKEAVHELPALLPEVWLHWDPKTVQQRGVDALARFRMDFLMLLPASVRVVLEVDGQQHYSRNGRPDPATYANMAAADRDLRLAGYEVYRFGGAELEGERGEDLLREFFAALFKKHHLDVK